MDQVIVSTLKQIHHPKGDVFHAIKKSDDGFFEFGEAYFSTVRQGEVKGWKKHTRMIMNLVVPLGEIEFVIYDEVKNKFFEISLSRKNYKRITVQPGLWVAFRGIGEDNLLLNVASLEHDPTEAENIALDKINYEW